MAFDSAAFIEQVKEMTVLELSELVKTIEEEFDVSAAAPVAVMAAGDAGGSAAQTEFDVILTSAGQKKIAVIKAIKEVLGLGLKEAKGFVDEAPKAVKEKISEAEANELKEKLEAEGASVEVK